MSRNLNYCWPTPRMSNIDANVRHSYAKDIKRQSTHEKTISSCWLLGILFRDKGRTFSNTTSLNEHNAFLHGLVLQTVLYNLP